MKTIPIILLILTNSLAAQQEQSLRAEARNIPESTERVFKTKALDRQYEYSFHLNPFYLRGDFNGDGQADIAILVKQKMTGKIGIAVIHSSSNEVFFIGAGTRCGNGGDNFDWMDIWQVYQKGIVHRGVGEKRVPRLIGEGLYVGKSESASGLVYWNGKKYVWYQQGD
jgi:hypothetical protein